MQKMKPDPDTEALLLTAGTTGALGLVVGVFTGVIERRHGSIGAWLAGIAAAVLVAAMVGLALKPTGMDPMWQHLIVGCCAYLADDVLAGLRVLGTMVRTDPLGGAGRFLDALRGKGRKE